MASYVASGKRAAEVSCVPRETIPLVEAGRARVLRDSGTVAAEDPLLQRAGRSGS
jgi:hypothetical protein